jgi:hypothetical protein
VPAALARAATTGAPDTGPDSLAESLTSTIRDVVRARVLATTGTPSQGVSKLIAGADGSLASGDVVTAVAQLLSAWKLVS